jgi:hypothetical protein
MKKELYRTFDTEIQKYRNTLVHYAKHSDWDSFKANAGRLFDYCEIVEMTETERRFTRIFGLIMIVLFLVLAFFFKIQLENSPELMAIKRVVLLSAIAGSGYEFYFFLNFRLYMDYKTAFYKERKEIFIKNIEQDFRDTCG